VNKNGEERKRKGCKGARDWKGGMRNVVGDGAMVLLGGLDAAVMTITRSAMFC